VQDGYFDLAHAESDINHDLARTAVYALVPEVISGKAKRRPTK
jgi:hypothetical protein